MVIFVVVYVILIFVKKICAIMNPNKWEHLSSEVPERQAAVVQHWVNIRAKVG